MSIVEGFLTIFLMSPTQFCAVLWYLNGISAGFFYVFFG
jgi:hypothetical protein